MTDYLTSSVTYSIVPPILTSWLQKFVYSSKIIPAQHPQSPKFRRDHLIIYILLAATYLVYTSYTAYTGLEWTYYDVLGVSTSVTPAELRSRFKTLSKVLHPDKSSTTNGAFLEVRHAYQTLLNPIKRKAYDLFGPFTTQWDFPTEREYLLGGLAWGVLPNYTITFIALQVWSLFGRESQIKYWRYLQFLVLLVFELHVITNPSLPPLLSKFPRLENLPRFQFLAILHKVSLSLILSLEHLAPLYTPQLLSSMVLSRTEATAVQLLDESNRLLTGEMGPALADAGDEVEVREMLAKLKDDIVDLMVSERIRTAKAG